MVQAMAHGRVGEGWASSERESLGLSRITGLNPGWDFGERGIRMGPGDSWFDVGGEQSKIMSSLLEGRICDEENILMAIVIRNTEHPVYAMFSSKCFTCINSLNPLNTPVNVKTFKSVKNLCEFICQTVGNCREAESQWIGMIL